MQKKQNQANLGQSVAKTALLDLRVLCGFSLRSLRVISGSKPIPDCQIPLQ